jgi:hypothetical protein
VVYGGTSAGNIWVAELKKQLVRTTDKTQTPPKVTYGEERARCRFFVPTWELHKYPAAVTFWQGQVQASMRLPSESPAAFKAAAQERAHVTRPRRVHYSYARDGAQRCSTIIGSIANISEHLCNRNQIVCFTIDQNALFAARRNVARAEHGMISEAEDLVAARGGVSSASAAACTGAASATTGLPVEVITPSVPVAAAEAPPMYGQVHHQHSFGHAELSEEEQLAMALSLSMQDQQPQPQQVQPPQQPQQVQPPQQPQQVQQPQQPQQVQPPQQPQQLAAAEPPRPAEAAAPGSQARTLSNEAEADDMWNSGMGRV